MTDPSSQIAGCFPAFDAALLERLAALLPTWALSTESPWQQWGLAEGIVRGAPGNQVLMSAAAGLLCWAWQARPLHAPVLALLTALDAQLKFLSAPVRERVTTLKKAVRPLPENPAWEDARSDPDEARAFLERVMTGPQAAPWLDAAWPELEAMEDADRADALVRACAPDPGLAARLLAQLAAVRDPAAPPPALEPCFAPWAAHARARAAWETGDRAAAASNWGPLWRAMPWNANLTLTLHDALHVPADAGLPGARTAVLVYSWNKAELLEQTLASVFASDIGDNPVFVLDNGSADATPEMLRAYAGRVGENRLSVVRLPVNVGAPAARNWLLSLPEVRACAYAAFLDDDVILPRDWLSRLLSAAARHPECGTVGCRIRDHQYPRRLQSADYHLLHRLPGEQGEEPGERLRVFNNCTGMTDTGLFAYERPCLSVSGCCHLLDLSLLDTVGAFDVRFTPTQFDDLDRDIRSCLAGRPCLFAGGLAIDHVQRSSLRQATSAAQVAHIQGNKIKLEAKYDDRQVDAMVEAGYRAVWADLLAKAGRVGAALSA